MKVLENKFEFLILLVVLAVVGLSINCSKRSAGPPSITDLEEEGFVAPYADFLLPPEEYEAPSRETISNTEALSDFSLVERIFRRGYAGFDYFERHGVNWDQVFAAGRKQIEAMAEPINVEDYRDWIAEAFSFTNDGHLAFSTVAFDGKWRMKPCNKKRVAYALEATLEEKENVLRTVESSSKELPTGAALVACEDRELAELLSPTVYLDHGELKPAWLLIQLSAERPPAQSCTFLMGNGEEKTIQLAWHRLKIANRAKSKKPPYEYKAGETPLIRLRTYSVWKADAQEEFVNTASELRKKESFVVDVSGNPGGTDRYHISWYQQLSSQTYQYGRLERIDSEVTVQGRLLDALKNIADGRLNENETKRARQRADAAYKRIVQMKQVFSDHPNRTWTKYSYLTEGKARSRFKGSLVTLMDNKCASSCESFVLYARQIPNGLTVGENTAGIKMFGECINYPLRNSRIWMKTPQKVFKLKTDRMYQKPGAGFHPDIWLDSEMSQVWALRIAECLRNEDCAKPIRAAVAKKRAMMRASRLE